MENETKQHVQLPNQMSEHNLTPKDQLIYAVIKSHNNKDNQCFPSLATIAAESGISIPTVRKCIDHLSEASYLTVKKVGRKQYYYFNPTKKFEPISPEFLAKKDITSTTKAYIIAAQQYMYKDIKDYGKMSFPNTQLSKIINMPESTIRKCNTELSSKGYLDIIYNKSKEIDGSGCNTRTKIFQLTKLGQAIIWKLKDHEDRIEQNSNDIKELQNTCKELKETIQEQKKLIDKLLKSKATINSDFTI
jgi:DNA-binding transcriptional regulator YhcF (GntR family)